MHHDLTRRNRVRAALGIPVDTALLKGRANYVCLHHLEAAQHQGTFAAREEVAHLKKIASFARRTVSGDRGDCADVPENSGAWAQATSKTYEADPTPAVRERFAHVSGNS